MIQEIHKLIEKLPELDWWGRRKAIKDLMAYPEAEYISFLESGIRDHTNANIRNAAMEVYAALGARAFRSLSGLLADDDPETRLFCVNVLCEIRDKRALPLLFRSMNDPDINVRAASAEAMGKIGDPESIALLQEALGDVRYGAGREEECLLLVDSLDEASGADFTGWKVSSSIPNLF